MEYIMRYGGGQKVITEFTGHTVVADQHVADGGENAGPTPFEYFFVSLGACAATYIYNFCMKREIPCENISLKLEVLRNDEGRASGTKILVNLPPDFPEKYKKAIISAAEMCAVKKFIQSAPEFHIEIND